MSLAPRISVIADDWCNPSLQSCLRASTATDTSMIPPWRFSVSRKMAGCAPIFFSVAGRCGFSRVHALYEMRPIYFFERSRTRPLSWSRTIEIGVGYAVSEALFVCPKVRLIDGHSSALIFVSPLSLPLLGMDSVSSFPGICCHHSVQIIELKSGRSRRSWDRRTNMVESGPSVSVYLECR
jgi:hypothetical protein